MKKTSTRKTKTSGPCVAPARREAARRDDTDFLDEVIAERTTANPDFPQMVEAATRARQLVRSLVARRQQLHLSQTLVAARMGTSQSALARLEAGDTDPRISTIARYALALGEDIAHHRAPR